MTAIKEGKKMSWEQISLALYGILDDIDTCTDAAKVDNVMYRGLVEKLQQKKNQYMESLDGQTVQQCNEGLVDHARREIEIVGLNSKEADYDGMIGEAVLELMETFAKQGHSGFSAQWVLDVFERLAKYQNLSPLTSHESEWNDVSEMSSDNAMWQSNRNPEAFSRDGGKLYYILSELDETCEEQVIDPHTDKPVFEEDGSPQMCSYTQMKKEYQGHPELWPMHDAVTRE